MTTENSVITSINSPALSDDLKSLEKEITLASNSYVTLGRAFGKIDVGTMYSQRGFKTFDEYCRTMFDRSKNSVYKLIQASRIYDILKETFDTLPINEAQCRPLAVLEDKDLIPTWTELTSTGDKITAKAITEAVNKIMGKEVIHKDDKKDTNKEIDETGTIEKEDIEITPDIESELNLAKAKCLELESELIEAKAITPDVPRSKMALELYKAGYKVLMGNIQEDQQSTLTALYNSLKG